MPPAMRAYISNYGFHFNKKAFECAVHGMKKENDEEVKPYDKDNTEALLTKYGINVKGGEMYDKAYVATMCVADYLNKSVPNEQYMAQYIKDVLDDPDGSDELPFRFWLQKCVALGKPIEWEDMM